MSSSKPTNRFVFLQKKTPPRAGEGEAGAGALSFRSEASFLSCSSSLSLFVSDRCLIAVLSAV